MKKYVYLIAMAVLAIQFLSCSKSDEEKVLQQQDPVMSRSLSDGTEIPTGAIGGTDAKPVEGQMFYEERSSDIVLISVLGTFSTIDQDDKVEVNNLGGAVHIKDGGSFTITYKGKGMHIVGSGITHPQTGFTYHTKLSLDIDDASLIESGDATITNFDLSETWVIDYGTWSITNKSHLSASDIPMVGGLPHTRWEGGTITAYSWTSSYSSLYLVDNPANNIEVWVHFKDDTVVKARIGK